MSLDRRMFVSFVSAGVAASLMSSIRPLAAAARIRAIALDAFAVFDARPVFALGERVFPGRGAELASVWRARQFEYQWLRAASGQYADFWQATEGALVYAANLLKLDLTAQKHEQLMTAYLEMKAWPDAPPALRTLKRSGIRLALLSNATAQLLDLWVANSLLDDVFEHVLSTDTLKTFKPDPRAYRLALDAFGLTREEIAFAAFGGWDAAGAKWFGYPTFWVNRQGQPLEELGVAPDGTGSTLSDLVRFVVA